jgi:hypothetical protein
VAHATEELDLVLLYLLPPAAAVTLLPPGEVPVHVPGEEPETRRDAVNQGDPGRAVRLARRRKAKSHSRRTPSLLDSLTRFQRLI